MPKFSNLLLYKTPDFAVSCGAPCRRMDIHSTIIHVPEMTQCVVLYRNKNRTLSGTKGGCLWLDCGGVDEHDRNVILDGIDAPALTTFQSLLIRGRQNRLLADRTHQHVKQILRHHMLHIVFQICTLQMISDMDLSQICH